MKIRRIIASAALALAAVGVAAPAAQADVKVKQWESTHVVVGHKIVVDRESHTVVWVR
ncbi:hypothetical protein [Yinghuangia seranimata]|uniref:hypothetical protein n=1 Tax=Yinghuangia seranimata TaxID=408067 RepID=UPI00248D0674|nr:hypothetical protein [Yinghuangia seranimata]MDI2125775.1 hypothetical protein [Yinghuangia seranimata]